MDELTTNKIPEIAESGRKGGRVTTIAEPSRTSRTPVTRSIPRVLTGEDAARVQEIFSRPARKPTPAMQRAIAQYKVLKSARRRSG